MAITSSGLIELFQSKFPDSPQPLLYRAPGRVNLIGEHTDYNQGFVLPIALDLACYSAIAPAQHSSLRVYSRDFDETSELSITKLASAEPRRHWSDYVFGVAQQLIRSGYAIAPANIVVATEVPTGAGLSSSAALEVAIAIALIGSRCMDKLELAKLCQRAESEFVGMPCGIMDQFVSVFGERSAAIQIDCRNLQFSTVPLDSNATVIAVNSMVKHELGSSAYRTRVQECKEALQSIRGVNRGMESLRDVSIQAFEQMQDSIPSIPRRRARHVITENERVLDFAAAARHRDLDEMGRLFIASHRSMQYDYEITCAEIDFLVDTAIKIKGVYGARMTGGGFGGCTVNLVAPEKVDEFRNKISASYFERFGRQPSFIECRAGAGAGSVK